MNKQVVLFVVEGTSDQVSFDNILNRLLNNDKIKFLVIHGDITTVSAKYNVKKKISKRVLDFIQEPKNSFIKISDIKKIVHLVDLDGVFINESLVVKNDNNVKEYRENEYAVPNVTEILERNKNKSEVIKELIKTCYINVDGRALPYEIYYFSCNLEHVLHDNPNVYTDSEKEDLSNRFAETYLGYETEFIKFINDNRFAFDGNYKESWKDAIKEENALKRKTNFNIFFSGEN